MDSTSVKHAKKIHMTWRAKSFCSQLFPFVLPRAEDEDREPMPFEPEAAGIYWFFSVSNMFHCLWPGKMAQTGWTDAKPFPARPIKQNK